jgi:hypothetical protein
MERVTKGMHYVGAFQPFLRFWPRSEWEVEVYTKGLEPVFQPFLRF